MKRAEQLLADRKLVWAKGWGGQKEKGGTEDHESHKKRGFLLLKILNYIVLVVTGEGRHFRMAPK